MAQQRTVSVKVTLLAENYFAGLAKMQAESKKTATSAEQAFNKQKAAFETLGRGALVASGIFTAAFVAMVKASADFEQRMSQVQALSKATASQMENLRGAAFNAGKAFGLSATQVADAQIELTKAGVGVKDIIGGALPGALALAAAGQIDVSKATEIASNAMTEFKLTGKDVPHVADLLAAGADKSVASVESLGDALNQSGLVASQFGLSVEDTVGTLTAFSKAGLNGSDAGTSFKTMLLSLASPSKQAQKILDEYNITAYDSQGAFVGITGLADQLKDKLGGLSQAQRNAALSTVFGTDAIRSASVLYELGGKKLQGFIDANNEAGFATLQASKKLDNLNGDVQKLAASFQNDLIEAGSAGNDALRGVTQTATGLLTVFGELPKPVQGSALVIAGVGAAVTAASAAFLLLVPRIAAAKVAMADLNITGKGLAVGFGKGAGVALGVTALTSGLANLASQGESTAAQLNLSAKSVKNDYAGIDKLFASGGFFTGLYDAKTALGQITAPLGAGNLSKVLDGMTLGITHFSDVFKTTEGQFKAFGQQFAALANTNYSDATASFGQFVTKLGGGADAAKQALQAMPAYRDEIVKLLTASGQAASEQNILAAAMGQGGVAGKIASAQSAATANAGALETMKGAAQDADGSIKNLSDTISGFGSVTLDVRSAQRAFQQSVDDAADAVKKNGRTLDISTAAGRANQDALDGIASSAIKAASALAATDGGADKAAGALASGRKQFISAATAMGISRAAAKKLADQLGLIPSNVKTTISVGGGAAAAAQIADIKRRMNNLDGTRAEIYIKAVQTGASSGRAAQIAKNAGFAGGGMMPNIGPKGKDSFLIAAGAGEFMFRSATVDKAGGAGAMYAIDRAIQSGTLRGYAGGGAIGESKNAAAKAKRDAARYEQQLKAANRAEKAAEKTYDAISGKEKDRAAKRAAKTRLDKARDRVSDLEKKLSKAKADASSSSDKADKLRDAREDFVSGERRGSNSDPLNYVDQLRSMSRDDAYSAKNRAKFKDAANGFEKALVDLGKRSQDAADKLGDLKQSAEQMRSSIVSAIAGGYQLSGVSSLEQTGSTFMDGGISFQTTTSGLSAGAIDAYYAGGAASSGSFAADLQTLAQRGLDGRLLAELAGYGVEQGAPIAKALLSATSGQITSINSNYAAIQGNAAAAAGTVTDVNYKALIDSAQANADQITAQLKADGEKLRKLIADAFGLTGYAVGTMNAAPGWHLVGEQGPELANFGRGGGAVLTAPTTTQMIAGARTPSMSISGPSSVTIVDADGTLIGSFTTAARSVAQQEIHTNAAQGAVALLGKGWR